MTEERKRKADRGFTLIELLTVLVIIMILVGIIVGASKYAQTKGGSTRAQAEIAAIETALESFKSDNGYYPSSTEFRDNPWTNSIMLYNALAAGPKTYMTFKPTEMQPNPNFPPIATFSVLCTTNISVIETNVMLVDPFGHPYNYFNRCGTGGANNQSFDLWSNGPSGITGAVDAITNWKPN